MKPFEKEVQTPQPITIDADALTPEELYDLLSHNIVLLNTKHPTYIHA